MVNSRPDLAYAMSILSQFSTKPRCSHWQAAQQVLRYVHGTLSFGINDCGGDILLAIRMRIGRSVLTLVVLLWAIVSSLVAVLFLGSLKSNALLLHHLPRLNTRLIWMLHPKLCGFNKFFHILDILPLHQPLFRIPKALFP